MSADQPQHTSDDYCDVCSGSRMLRVPRRPQLSDVKADPFPAMELYATAEFPCPQCSPGQLTYDRLQVLKETSERAVSSDPRHQDAIRRSMVHKLAVAMYERGLISFEEAPAFRYGEPMQVTRASVGVVSPVHVKTMEERVAERQFEVAEQMIDEVTKSIDNWGSFYGFQQIPKSEAARAMRDALQVIKNKFRKR